MCATIQTYVKYDPKKGFDFAFGCWEAKAAATLANESFGEIAVYGTIRRQGDALGMSLLRIFCD
jgi:hypothetical protein